MRVHRATYFDIHKGSLRAIVILEMATKRQIRRWIRGGLPSLEELKLVVDALNGKELFCIEHEPEFFERYDQQIIKTPPILRRLVEQWDQSDRNLETFARRDPTTWADLASYFKERPMELSWGPGGHAAVWHPITDRQAETPYREALRFFLLLITNLDCERLAGPCARCGHYYIRASRRNKLYCSRSCGTGATAVAATRKRRDAERADKLRRADEASHEYEKSRTKVNWKDWVSSKERDITPRFLTRAVNQGELREPIRSSKEKQ
jgi:hypothetical protein